MKAALLTAFVLGVLCSAQEPAKLTIDIPAAVQQTIAKEKGDNGKVLEFKRLNESDGATYALTLEIDGRPYEMILDGAGRVMRKEVITSETEEKEIDLQKLPEVIKKTLLREAGGAPMRNVRVREEKTRYMAEIVSSRTAASTVSKWTRLGS
jgi:hypothetical protein